MHLAAVLVHASPSVTHTRLVLMRIDMAFACRSVHILKALYSWKSWEREAMQPCIVARSGTKIEHLMPHFYHKWQSRSFHSMYVQCFARHLKIANCKSLRLHLTIVELAFTHCCAQGQKNMRVRKKKYQYEFDIMSQISHPNVIR
jgi:hypothetical protein